MGRHAGRPGGGTPGGRVVATPASPRSGPMDDGGRRRRHGLRHGGLVGLPPGPLVRTAPSGGPPGEEPAAPPATPRTVTVHRNDRSGGDPDAGPEDVTMQGDRSNERADHLPAAPDGDVAGASHECRPSPESCGGPSRRLPAPPGGIGGAASCRPGDPTLRCGRHRAARSGPEPGTPRRGDVGTGATGSEARASVDPGGLPGLLTPPRARRRSDGTPESASGGGPGGGFLWSTPRRRSSWGWDWPWRSGHTIDSAPPTTG